MACTAFSELQLSRPPQIAIPLFMNMSLKYESQPENLPEKAANYLKCIQSLSRVQEIGIEEYFIILKICLYLEQYQIDQELKRHSLKSRKVQKAISGHRFVIDVPSLTSEQSVIVPDDKVFLYHVGTKQKIMAKVVQVSKNKVTIQLQTKVDENLFNDSKFDINFVSQHWPLRCCHYAITEINMRNWSPLIYPKVEIPGEDVEFDIEWINFEVAKNEQQKQAVKKILNKTAHPAPYIIFGPPGTGKTATLVETICQIVRQHPTENILVCTASNAAADEITRRLIGKVPENILFRTYAPSRPWEKVDKQIRQYANFVDEKTIFFGKEQLLFKRIIITTLVTSLRLCAVGFRENHFSYIIIDEASQAIEPEMLIPFVITNSGICNDLYPQVVIAGDPHQLGPVVRCKKIEHLLGISMLERLMNSCEPYKKQNRQYNPNYITKLIKNYRSHEKLLHVSNDLFYDYDLVACGGADTQIALNWPKLPNKNFPMIFQEVQGEEERTSSKSVYNQAEALVVVHYVKMLMKTKFANCKITAKDIGIITPFKQQQLDIAQKLAAIHLEDVTVGTVEIFQGQEKPVIILSTVRSKIFEHNGREHIGFLSNPKRFNVALTRAKALTIVIGNSNVLRKSKHWEVLWEYCKDQKGYIPFDQCPLQDQLKKIRLKGKVINQDSEKKLSLIVEYGENNENSKELSNVLVRKMDNLTL